MTSWFVLMGHYGHEEDLRQAMMAAGCDAWYPREKVRVRAKLIEMPLDRYVFVAAEAPLSAELWHVAGDCDGFRGWLGGEEPIALRVGELEVWRGGFDGAGVLDEAASERLRRGWDVGDHVMVIGGLYAGMVGRVTRLRKNNCAEALIFALPSQKASISLPVNAFVRVLVHEEGDPDAVRRGGKTNNRVHPSYKKEGMLNGSGDRAYRATGRRRLRRSKLEDIP